jgi:hypothetical protein
MKFIKKYINVSVITDICGKEHYVFNDKVSCHHIQGLYNTSVDV